MRASFMVKARRDSSRRLAVFVAVVSAVVLGYTGTAFAAPGDLDPPRLATGVHAHDPRREPADEIHEVPLQTYDGLHRSAVFQHLQGIGNG